MKKIITKEERDRKERRNKIIIGAILAGLMVLSSAGYAIYNTGSQSIEKIKYREIEFSLREDGLWHFQVSGNEFATSYNPEQTQNITFLGNLNLGNLAGNPLYFSYDSNKEAIQEIASNIGRFSSRIQTACIEKCDEDLPVKNCSENIIIIAREANESLIKQEENCIYVLGEDARKSSDAFIFKSLGL